VQDTELYRGKAKIVYTTKDPSVLRMHFKDDASAFNRKKLGTIEDKGRINCAMSAIMMKLIEKSGVPTHFIEQTGPQEMLVRRLKMFPVEVVIRNVIAGSLSKRLGIPEGTPVSNPFCEFYYKDDDLDDPMVLPEHIVEFRWTTMEELDEMRTLALKINDVMTAFFDGIGLKLIDFKLEFGMFEGKMLLGDELSPDGMRLWDKETGKKMDKDRFRRDLGGVEEAYQEVLSRIQAETANQ